MNHVLKGRLLAAAALAAWPSAVQAARIEVQHEPLDCALADRFVRIAAKASPPASARSVELHFRTDADGGWYSVAMKDEAGEWSAVLPRPTATLTGFEYRIAVRGEGGEASETPVVAVRVGADPSACGGAAQSSVSSSIVVRVPPGAPVVPPVPRGFNPTAVVAAQERESKKTKKAVIIAGGAAVAGAMTALAVGGSSESAPAPPDVPGFGFDGTIPPPGSTISLSRDTLQLLVRMTREPNQPLTLDWRVEWRQSASGPVCVLMGDRFNGAQRPTGLVFTAPLVAPGACGSSFDASLARLTITIADRVYLDHMLTLPFRFEP